MNKIFEDNNMDVPSTEEEWKEYKEMSEKYSKHIKLLDENGNEYYSDDVDYA